MIPSVEDDLTEDYEVEEQPSLAWKISTDGERLSGETDGLESIRQTIYAILNTERYGSMIYSWDYGVELSDLIGEPVSYVLPEIKRRITEALTQDDRITDVSGFEFDTSKKRVVQVAFQVETAMGSVQSEIEVNT